MPRNNDNIKPATQHNRLDVTNEKIDQAKIEDIIASEPEPDEIDEKEDKIRTAAFTKSMEKLILKAASEKKQLRIRYKKGTTGEIKTYIICPYSYRYKFSAKGGRYRMLFGYDIKDKHIKGFYLKNLLRVEKLNRGFRPIWPIEIY